MAERPIDTRGALELRRELYAQAELIRVDVQLLMGLLYLRGSVADEAARSRAERLASRLGGVEQIRNRIRIVETPLPGRDDAAIERDLARSLSAVEGLALRVHDGRVEVRGTAPDAASAAAWIEAVRQVEGVRAIDFGELRFRATAPSPP